MRTNQSILAIRSQLTALFFELEEAVGKESKCKYEQHASQYKKLWIDVELLAMRERTKYKNKTTSAQIEILDKGLRKLQKKHKKACLSPFEIRLINQSLTRMLDSILRFEEAKLRGAKKPYNLSPMR